MSKKKVYSDTPFNHLGGGVSDQLRGYVKRLEYLDQQLANINTEKTLIFREAKAVGLCKNTIRKLIARRSKERQEVIDEDDLLELYAMALSTDTITE